MKSLFITYNEALEPLIESQAIAYLKGLSEKGIHSVLLSFEKKKQGEKVFKEKAHKLKKELKKYNIKWHYLRYHKRPSLAATIFDILQGIVVGIFICVKEKINIVHARSTVPGAMAYAISRLIGKKFIFDVRGLMAEEFVDGGMWKKESVNFKITSSFEKKFIREADGVIVLSNKIKSFLEEGGYLGKNTALKSDITAIPCCADLIKFKRSKSSSLREKYGLRDKFIFLYTGSLGTWYMAGEMLDFFICAKKVIPSAHFMFLINTGREILEEECKDKKIDLNDITIDKVDFKDMPDFISIADAGIFFIKPCLSKESSCPTKFAEYLACELPVIINRGIGDTGEIVDRYNIGAVVNRFDEENYSGVISDFMKLRSEGIDILRKRCREVAEKEFSLQNGVESYFNIYKKSLERQEN